MENFEIIKPFGPSIVKIKMPNEMISEMNKYVDTIIQDKEKSQKLNYGKQLIGKVQQEFLMEIDFMKKIKWAEFLGSNVHRWVSAETENKIEKFELIRSCFLGWQIVLVLSRKTLPWHAYDDAAE